MAPYGRLTLFFITLVVSTAQLASSHNLVARQQPSAVPPGPPATCNAYDASVCVSGSTYICPATDSQNYAVCVPAQQWVSGEITCSYPIEMGNYEEEFTCTYSASTGALLVDNNVDLCRSQSDTCTGAPPPPRRRALPTRPNRVTDVGALDFRPDLMKTQRSLRKRKHAHEAS